MIEDSNEEYTVLSSLPYACVESAVLPYLEVIHVSHI